MAEYRIATADPNGPVVHTPSNTNVPNNPADRQWMEYKFWLARGNKPDPYIPPAPPPDYDFATMQKILEGGEPPKDVV